MSNGSTAASGGVSASQMGRPTVDPRRRGGGAAPGGPPSGESSRHEIQAMLAQFDAKINQMMDYPAKDVINSLTMLAERVQYAPEIVSFLETKIHRAPPNYKLPIFYLTDSILKNVRGPYVALLGRNIVPLYCNCVKQVNAKDLGRFVHVLNTWDQTRLFPLDALAQMRAAANRALAVANGTGAPPPPAPTAAVSAPPRRPAPPQHDMELRSLLTQMQNDMGIHPTEHLTLEQVRVQNPEWYNQLVEYHMASQQQSVPNASVPPQQQQQGGGALLSTPVPPAAAAQPPSDPRAAPRQPRRSRFSDRPPPGAIPPPHHHHVEPPKSANAAHLMDLLKRKAAPAHPQHPEPQPMEITNDGPRSTASNTAAVMSILQKLKGLNSASTQAPSQQAPAPLQPTNDSSASKMWFSDTIVAHKERVESNVQKLYAALPFVCRESGLRFKEQEKLNAHLDFLFQYNRAQKERGKGGMSRSWYPDEDQWVLDFSGEVAPRETTSSSFFDRKTDNDDDSQGQYENARVPADEGVTRCMICGESFAKSWDEDEEDWMYTNAVYGTIHNPSAPHEDRKTIFHKYCYDTVMANSKVITQQHLIPGTPQSLRNGGGSSSGGGNEETSGVKRNLDEDSDDSDDEDDGIKRIKTQ